MPQIFRIGSYWGFFWSNENMPLEPVHVAVGKPNANATKIWITKSGKCLLCNNTSNIQDKILKSGKATLGKFLLIIKNLLSKTSFCRVQKEVVLLFRCDSYIVNIHAILLSEKIIG